MKKTRIVYECILILFLSFSKSMQVVYSKDEHPHVLSPFLIIEHWMQYYPGGRRAQPKSQFFIRRGRMGMKGVYNDQLSYSFMFHFDRLGQNPALQKGRYKGVNIWNTYLSYKAIKSSSLFNIHAGYFWSAVSREYNTVPWNIGSFDKTESAINLRRFVTGKNNGIVPGVALGGHWHNAQSIGFDYRAGIYQPETPGYNLMPLYTGRFMFVLGQPEQEYYKYMLPGTLWKQRRGITLSTGISYQQKMITPDSIHVNNNMAYGADMCFDYAYFRCVAEYYMLHRKIENTNRGGVVQTYKVS